MNKPWRIKGRAKIPSPLAPSFSPRRIFSCWLLPARRLELIKKRTDRCFSFPVHRVIIMIVNMSSNAQKRDRCAANGEPDSGKLIRAQIFYR